jgi:hypothetical protein
MTHKSTPQWQPTTPTLATVQPTPIVLIPSPKWIHPTSLPSADDKVWPTNLINIIQAIKETPLQQPTQTEFSFKLTSKAAKKNYLTLMHVISHLDMYHTNVLMYRTMVLLAHLTKGQMLDV